MKATLKRLLPKLKARLQAVEKGLLNSIARDTGLVQRNSSKISGWDFFQLMTTEHFKDAVVSLEGLCDVLRTINPKAVLSAQALQQRIVSKKAVSFMKEVFSIIYRKHLTPLFKNIPPSVFDTFNRVFLQDSTQIELNQRLAEAFRGFGGCASKSAMKIDLIYEYKQSILERVTISKATVSDSKRSNLIMDVIRKGDLIIRDLGYFVLDTFSEVAEKGAYYLSRCKHIKEVYLTSNPEDARIDLLKLIEKNIEGNILDIAIFFRRQKNSVSNGGL